jgi:hypothetical protein
MSKNFYEEGFPDDDPTDELPILADVVVEQDDDRTQAHQTLTAEEDTGPYQQPDPKQIPTLQDRDETRPELVPDIADRDAKLAALEAELENLESRWQQTSEELTARTAELTDARSELESLRAKRGLDQEVVSQASVQVHERDQQIAALAADLEAARAGAKTLEHNARVLEQRIADLEAENAAASGAGQSDTESATNAKLRDELAALAAHIENRNTIWRKRAAEVIEKSMRIRELELELEQRVEAQSAAEHRAEMEIERARDYRERLVAATAALHATQLGPVAERTEAARALESADETVDRPRNTDRLSLELERAVALQQNAGDDSDGLRRLEELELAIRELERGMDDTPEDSPRMPQTEYVPPQLICLTSDAPETYALDDGEVVIGRGSHCKIRLMTHYVSREHARLATTDGACTLEDLGSRNGVFVNSVRIERQALNNDDLITIGDTQFRFRAAERARS